jgi:hypothetical protein
VRIAEIGIVALLVFAMSGIWLFRGWDVRHQQRRIARWAALREWRYAERDDPGASAGAATRSAAGTPHARRTW